MERLLAEAQTALRAGLYMVALQSTLTLVDICGALNSEDGQSRRTRFEQWFADHVSPRYPSLSASDVYQLRCGMLHQGQLKSPTYESLVFTLPDNGGSFLDQISTPGVMCLSLAQFCIDTQDACLEWWEANRYREPVRRNSQNLVQIRPAGFPGTLMGFPVLA